MDYNPPGFSVHGIFQPTGVGCSFLLQGIFLTQRLNQDLLHWQAIFFFFKLLNHLGRPVLSPNKGTIILLSLLTNRMWHKVMLITPESRSQNGSLLCDCFSPGSLVVGGGKSHAVRSSSNLWRGPCAEELEPPANSQHHLASHRRQPPWRWICQPQSSLHFDSHLLKDLETEIPS